MRYLMLLTGSAQTPPPPELFEGIMKLGGEATEAGVLLDTAGLVSGDTGAQVSVADGEITVTDGTGPAAPAAYTVYDLRSKEEAIEWASRFMKLHRDHWKGWQGTTTIVQVMDTGA
jgi:hypothetical protein